MNDLQPITPELAESVANELFSYSAKAMHEDSCVSIKEWKTEIKNLLLSRLAMPQHALYNHSIALQQKEIESLKTLVRDLQERLAAKSPSKEVYILLQEGEVIREGDEFYYDDEGMADKWKLTHPTEVGKKWGKGYNPFRRKLSLPLWPSPIKFSERMPEEGDMIRAFSSQCGWGSEQCWTKGGFHHGYYSHWFKAEPPPSPIQPKTEGKEKIVDCVSPTLTREQMEVVTGLNISAETAISELFKGIKPPAEPISLKVTGTEYDEKTKSITIKYEGVSPDEQTFRKLKELLEEPAPVGKEENLWDLRKRMAKEKAESTPDEPKEDDLVERIQYEKSIQQDGQHELMQEDGFRFLCLLEELARRVK